MHRDLATRSPFAEGVLGHAQVLRCCGCVQVLGQLGHGMRSPCVCVNSDGSLSKPSPVDHHTANPGLRDTRHPQQIMGITDELSQDHA